MAEILDTSPYTNAEKVTEKIAYNARDLIIYALGIGSKDPRFIYENDSDFAAFPTYPIVLTFKGESFDTLPFPPPLGMSYAMPALRGIRVVLDAEKTIEKVAELPKEGAQLLLRGGVVSVQKKGKGALVERLFEILDDTGKLYYRIVDGTFMVGAKDFTDSGKSSSKSIETPKSAPEMTLETPTDENIPSLYRLSGDYNPLHVDPQFAQMGGFEKPIIHGQCTMGHVTRALLDALAGGDQKRFKSVQLRFASPVFPGQVLLTEVWKTSLTEVIFQTKVKETGKVCVSNGLFVMTPEGKL